MRDLLPETSYKFYILKKRFQKRAMTPFPSVIRPEITPLPYASLLYDSSQILQ